MAKVADYGISRVATADATMTHKGTFIYCAPEISRGERYGFAADIYSFAITMYELCDRVSFGVSSVIQRQLSLDSKLCSCCILDPPSTHP